jgi:hypothetical protein
MSQPPPDHFTDPSPYDDRPILAAREVMPDDDTPFGTGTERARGGCGLTTIILLTLALFGILIVALAAGAGWTTGQRQAGVFGTSTQQAAIAEQFGRIPTDVSDGNVVLLSARIRFLATLTPGVSGLSDVLTTATALYLTSQPTATATATATASTTASPTATSTPDPNLPTPTPGPRFDLARLLSEAQGEYASGRYADAADLAEAILAVDPAYETAVVRGILTDSLNALARNYYNAMEPAAGNQVVGRIEALGLFLGDGLAYERDVAELYLNAISNIGINFPQAIAALQELISFGQGRYYSEAVNLLYQQYMRYGDALAYDPNAGFCLAQYQYQNAFNLTGSGEASARLNDAQNQCANATPTFDPLLGSTPGAVAPIGAPGG